MTFFDSSSGCNKSIFGEVVKRDIFLSEQFRNVRFRVYPQVHTALPAASLKAKLGDGFVNPVGNLKSWSGASFAKYTSAGLS